MTEAPPIGVFRSRRGRDTLSSQRWSYRAKNVPFPATLSASRPRRRAPHAPGNGASRPPVPKERRDFLAAR
ncbi:hypothetical protein FBZ86_13125 [Gluconacetobacter diazotrophicus]|nr:hypothetical protein FBZ86_13125 [Gluconacetobacter diazotrophicus]